MSRLRARVTDWLERRWYGPESPGPLLRALAALFARIVSARRRAFVSGQKPGQRAAVPVIVVGNIAIGGAGKTPLTIALVQALQVRGFRPGVISRGYGREGTDTRRVQMQDDARLSGDEPLLIARRTRVPVAVAPRRIDAARCLLQHDAPDAPNVLIADDGLQHYALARDIEILAIDGRRRFGNGRLLPAGPLRESPERAHACDFIVINGGQPGPGEVPMQLQLSLAVGLRDGKEIPLADLRGLRIHAIAGIAEPARFFDALRAQGLAPETHAFPDHHSFSPDELDFPAADILLMTEKDAVKCAAFARENWYAVPATAHLPESFFDAVAARLAELNTHEHP